LLSLRSLTLALPVQTTRIRARLVPGPVTRQVKALFVASTLPTAVARAVQLVPPSVDPELVIDLHAPARAGARGHPCPRPR